MGYRLQPNPVDLAELPTSLGPVGWYEEYDGNEHLGAMCLGGPQVGGDAWYVGGVEMTCILVLPCAGPAFTAFAMAFDHAYATPER